MSDDDDIEDLEEEDYFSTVDSDFECCFESMWSLPSEDAEGQDFVKIKALVVKLKRMILGIANRLSFETLRL